VLSCAWVPFLPIAGRPTLAGVLLACSAVIVWLTAAARAQEFISYSSSPHHILEGSWQSCQDGRGQFAERVYDHVVNGVGQFEVHLGPRREFAIFAGVQEEHRRHESPENLLKPYRVRMENNLAKERWEIPSLKVVFTVTLGGGSRTDCEAWFILLEPLGKPSE